MKRRDFLKLGTSVGVAANALPILVGGFPIRALGRSPLRNALSTPTPNNNILVIVQLAGGNDGLNCIVPVSGSNYNYYKLNRPTLGLDKTKDKLLTIPGSDTLAMHSSMAGMSDLFNNKKMAILQNVGYPNPILSHFRGTDIWNTATDSNITYGSGWVGRLLSQLNPNYPPLTIPVNSQPLAIQFGNSLSNLFLSDNGGMGIAINKLPTSDDTSFHSYDAIDATPVNPAQELEYMRLIQNETETYTKALLNRSVKQNNATASYPANSTLGDQLSWVAQLIASGFTTKIYLVTQPGYDTHSRQLDGQSVLLNELSLSLAAFQNDLESFKINGSPVADNVAVMTYSEFGRRVQENGSGTDHGTAAPLFVIGTKVNPGIQGSDPNLDPQSLIDGNGNLTYDTNYDFRNVYATVISQWLGIDDTSIYNVLNTNALNPNNIEKYSQNTSSWNSNLPIFNSQSGIVNSDYSPGLMLMQNNPNPVSSATTIEYALPETMVVELGIFTTLGVEVARIVDERQEVGLHKAIFKPGNLPSGTYIYRLSTPNGQVAKQMIVLK